MDNGDFVQTKFIRTCVRFKLDKPNIILVKLTIFLVQIQDLIIAEAECVIVIKDHKLKIEIQHFKRTII